MPVGKTDAGVGVDKVNLFKELKAEYCQPKTPKLVEPSCGNYLAMDGKGVC